MLVFFDQYKINFGCFEKFLSRFLFYILYKYVQKAKFGLNDVKMKCSNDFMFNINIYFNVYCRLNIVKVNVCENYKVLLFLIFMIRKLSLFTFYFYLLLLLNNF